MGAGDPLPTLRPAASAGGKSVLEREDRASLLITESLERRTVRAVSVSWRSVAFIKEEPAAPMTRRLPAPAARQPFLRSLFKTLHVRTTILRRGRGTTTAVGRPACRPEVIASTTAGERIPAPSRFFPGPRSARFVDLDCPIAGESEGHEARPTRPAPAPAREINARVAAECSRKQSRARSKQSYRFCLFVFAKSRQEETADFVRGSLIGKLVRPRSHTRRPVRADNREIAADKARPADPGDCSTG